MTENAQVETSDEQCALVCMIVSNPGDGVRPHAWQKRVNDLIRALRDERNELQQIFDTRWAADMRAIEQWQKAHPGNDLVWPDHADLVVWLLGQIEAAHKALKPLSRIASDYIDARDNCDLIADEQNVYIKTLVTMSELRAAAERAREFGFDVRV